MGTRDENKCCDSGGWPSDGHPGVTFSEGAPGIRPTELLGLISDLWRLHERVSREGAAQSVALGCRRAMDRLMDLGFRIETLVGDRYDENLKVNVVEDRGTTGRLRIAQCLLPAVYYRGELVKAADVILEDMENE